MGETAEIGSSKSLLLATARNICPGALLFLSSLVLSSLFF